MIETVIDTNKNKININIKELFNYRELFLILALRDIKVRYAQTSLGFFWAFLQPLFSTVIFKLIFNNVAKVNTDPIPYHIFVMSGLCVWGYFAYMVTNSGTSLIQSQHLIQKIYFPRLIIPLSKAVVGFVDFLIALFFLICLMIFYKFVPNLHTIIYMPIFLFMSIIAGLGIGIWLSALSIRYRDFQHVIPFSIQMGMYLTPVAYPAYLIREKFLILYFLNPMAGIVEGFRWSIIGGPTIPIWYTLFSFCFISILFISSLFYFRKVEKIIADIV